VAEWQTRWTQNPVWATMCGFNSHLRYFLREKDLRRLAVSPFLFHKAHFSGKSVAERGLHWVSRAIL
jgi:hypothetical protein